MNCEPLSLSLANTEPLEFRVFMPQGIIGFNDLQHYTVTPLGNPPESSLFWELKSVQEQTLSFILMELKQLAIDDVTICPSDFTLALKHLDVQPEDCKIYVIVAIEADAEGKKTATANMRAPFVVHPATHHAWQVILPDPKYPVAKVI